MWGKNTMQEYNFAAIMEISVKGPKRHYPPIYILLDICTGRNESTCHADNITAITTAMLFTIARKWNHSR